MGARPLSRVIQEHIKRPLAEELLFGKLAKGGVVKVVVREGKIALDIQPPGHPRLPPKKTPLLTAS
jgi:ATP-dependent Clp protease ATP-binding subunit ClpA